MKIASQLLSTIPSATAKTGASLDNGAEFQGVLTAAAVKGTSRNEVPQSKGKLQTQDAGSQMAEIKKKPASPDTVAAAPVLDVPAPKQLPADAVTPFASSLPSTQQVPEQSSDQIVIDSHAGAELFGGRGSLSSPSSGSSTNAPLPTNLSTTSWAEHAVVDKKLAFTVSSEEAAKAPVADGTERPVSGARSFQPGLVTAQVAAVHPIQSQSDISSATVTVPATPTLPPQATAAVAPALVPEARPVPASPNEVLPVVVARTARSSQIAVSSVARPAPVTAAMTDSTSAVPASSDAPTALVTAAKPVPVTPGTMPPAVSPAPVAAARNALASAIAISPTLPPATAAAAKNVLASPVAIPPVVLRATIATVKTVPATPIAVPSVGPAVPVAISPASSAVQVSQPATPKAAAIDQAANASKATDTSESNPAVPIIDATTSATQQAATAVVQSVTASVSSPSLSFADESHAVPNIAANQTPLAGRVTDTVKETASRQTPSASKAKPVSGTAARGSNFAESDGTNTQTEGAPTATVAPAPRVNAASGTGNQGAGQSANESASLSGIANLQQAVPASPIGGASHLSQPSQSVSPSAEVKAQSIPAQAVPDSQPAQGVSSAQLIQSMRSSEMKLGMQSAEFGNISISTSLNHQALSAQISIDHSELGRALAVHLPAIEEKLGSAYGVQAKVELRDSNNPPSSNDSGYSNSGQQSREQRQSQGSGTAASRGATFERIAARASFTPVQTNATASRLDIRI